jgi:hypothetical protein
VVIGWLPGRAPLALLLVALFAILVLHRHPASRPRESPPDETLQPTRAQPSELNAGIVGAGGLNVRSLGCTGRDRISVTPRRLNAALAGSASSVLLVCTPMLLLFFFVEFFRQPKTETIILAAVAAAWMGVGWLTYVNLWLFRRILEDEAPSFYEREVKVKSFVPILMGSQFGAIAIHRLVVHISKLRSDQLSRKLRYWALFARTLNIAWVAFGVGLAVLGLWYAT